VPTAVRRRPPPGREHRLGRPARALADSRHVIGGRAPANRRSASSRRLRSVAILRVPRKTSTAPYASSGAADPKEEECFPSIPTRPVVRSAPSTCDAATSTAHHFTSPSGRLMFVGRTSRAPLATGEPRKPAKTRVCSSGALAAFRRCRRPSSAKLGWRRGRRRAPALPSEGESDRGQPDGPARRSDRSLGQAGSCHGPCRVGTLDVGAVKPRVPARPVPVQSPATFVPAGTSTRAPSSASMRSSTAAPKPSASTRSGRPSEALDDGDDDERRSVSRAVESTRYAAAASVPPVCLTVGP
jgi:hypothetical protein